MNMYMTKHSILFGTWDIGVGYRCRVSVRVLNTCTYRLFSLVPYMSTIYSK